MAVDGVIRVKAMLIALDADLTAHAVSLNEPTVENPGGYHRLIGGGVEFGETHRDAIVREVDEELGAAIEDLTFLGAVESIFEVDGTPGHEVVFLYTGRLDPRPPPSHATLTESDGSVVPVVWRSVRDDDETLPLYPGEATAWVRRLVNPSRLVSQWLETERAALRVDGVSGTGEPSVLHNGTQGYGRRRP